MSWIFNRICQNQKKVSWLFPCILLKKNIWYAAILYNSIQYVFKILWKFFIICPGMKSNRFGLLGYSSSGSTVRTIGGQMFGVAAHFSKALETLKYVILCQTFILLCSCCFFCKRRVHIHFSFILSWLE